MDNSSCSPASVRRSALPWMNQSGINIIVFDNVPQNKSFHLVTFGHVVQIINPSSCPNMLVQTGFYVISLMRIFCGHFKQPLNLLKTFRVKPFQPKLLKPSVTKNCFVVVLIVYLFNFHAVTFPYFCRMH